MKKFENDATEMLGDGPGFHIARRSLRGNAIHYEIVKLSVNIPELGVLQP